MGFGKCGTTAFLDFMGDHPDVIRGEFETFFRYDSEETYKSYIARRRCQPGGKVLLSKLDNNSNVTKTHFFYPRTKIMIMVCEPVRRVISAFTHYHTVEDGKVTEEHVQDFMHHQDAFFSCIKNTNRSRPCDELRFFKDYPGEYTDWHSYFKNIHIIDGDSFKKGPTGQLQQAEGCLGVQPYFKKSHFVYDIQKGFYCRRVANETSCMGPEKGRTHPTLPEQYINRLKQYVKPFNEKFFALVNRRFAW